MTLTQAGLESLPSNTILTRSGYRVSVNRVARSRIDAFMSSCPAPQPPVKTRKIYGGFAEEYYDTEDPAYVSELAVYYIAMAQEQFPLIADAINEEQFGDWRKDKAIQELSDLAILDSEPAFIDYLRFVVLYDSRDTEAVVNLILYLSTVTEQGIAQANALFAAQWDGKPIDAFQVKQSSASYSRALEDREAARFAGITWPDFAALTGLEQSMIVAHYRIHTRIEYIAQRQEQAKLKR